VSAAYAEPMTVRCIEGEVVILGPDAVAVSLTPAAAEESARRLEAAAVEARRHQDDAAPRPPD
jgi:hypothetical protein